MQLRWFSTVALALLAATATAAAQTPSRLGAFKDWTAYTYTDGRGKVCYAASQPTNTEPKNVNRGDIFFMVSTRPADRVNNEVSVLVGYPLRQDSKVSVDIDGKTFVMFTKEDGAWVENPADENVLVTALKGGSRMTIKGTSRRGTNTTDSYSLSGITAALDSATKACQ